MTITRRQTLGALGASALARPAVAQAARVLRFVPYVDLPVLDPIANTASQVRNHAFLIWDTLYGLDAQYQPQPQMVEGHRVDDDGRRWTLTLRPGLRFHDGTPVLARDCVASLRRWGAIDGFGMALFAAVNELSAPDDRTIVFRLKRPFPLLPAALGKMGPNIAAIMPERIASAPPNKPVAEIVGSGPYRFVANERVPGAQLVYARFAEYEPRQDAPARGDAQGFTSGAKVTHFDRVEWVVMPEPATALSALLAGEVDWIEAPPPDVLPRLRRSPGIVVETRDTTGVMPILRFNHLHPPFDSLAVRRAVLAAVDQARFMTAFSDDPEAWRVKAGAFCPGTPMANDAGLADRFGPEDIAAARRALAASGYDGARVVVMAPGDHPVNSVMAQVGADLMKRMGMTVDIQAMDAATMFQRRLSREPVDRGGWSVFPSAVAGIDVLDPAESFLVRGNGKDAWYGWPDDPPLEAMRAAWFVTSELEAQKALCARIQARLLDQAAYTPLGQILQPTARRREIIGQLPGFAKFWNVRRA